jgi:hypothetical protein
MLIAASIADFDCQFADSSCLTGTSRTDMASLANWPTPGLIADHLTRGLRSGRCLILLPFRVSRSELISRSDWLLVLHLLAFVIVVDAITSAASDLHASITIGSETMMANQRADTA